MGRHVPAVAQHRDAMADAIDLVETMRDVDDRHAAGDQPLHQREQLVHLAGGQRRGRLVHDQHRGLGGERLGDLDHLTVRKAEGMQRT